LHQQTAFNIGRREKRSAKTNHVVLLVQAGLLLGGHLDPLLSGDLGHNVGHVLGSKDLLGGDGLDSVLVVVDMLLSVDGLGGLDVFVLGDDLLGDRGSGLGADLGRAGLYRREGGDGRGKERENMEEDQRLKEADDEKVCEASRRTSVRRKESLDGVHS
jgi:hypothetical protein